MQLKKEDPLQAKNGSSLCKTRKWRMQLFTFFLQQSVPQTFDVAAIGRN
jgi:hypothetical protein